MKLRLFKYIISNLFLVLRFHTLIIARKVYIQAIIVARTIIHLITGDVKLNLVGAKKIYLLVYREQSQPCQFSLYCMLLLLYTQIKSIIGLIYIIFC